MKLLNCLKPVLFTLPFGLLGACAFQPSEPPPQIVALKNLPDYFVDQEFLNAESPPTVPPVDLLDLPKSTQQFLDVYVADLETEQERYQALRQWVFDQFANYEYDALETLSIANLINSRKVNCLSFSTMFVAAARYVGIPAHFQLVYAPPYWDADSDTWIVNQHVNVYGDVELSEPSGTVYQDIEVYQGGREVLYYRDPPIQHFVKNARQRYVVDINRAVVSIPFKTRPLNDAQLLALFYNNKAGEAFHAGDLPLAYAYTKAALEADRSLASVWNTLGALYQRHENFAAAEKVYLTAIALGEDIHSAQSNLAAIYRSSGRDEEAEVLEAAVIEHRRSNPYYHYALGEESLKSEKLNEAKQSFNQAITLKHNEELFYYALAKAEVKLKNYEAVEENLKNARIYAKGPDKARYSNKLDMFAAAVAEAQGQQ